MKSLPMLAVTTGLQLVPLAAHATKTYPPEMLKHYAIDSLPVSGDGCLLCHRSEEGGIGTISTPYGRAMMNRYGVGGANLPSLRSGLDEADAAGQDSDGDGVADADELLAGTNPNTVPAEPGMPEVPPSTVDDVPLPQTGCSVREAGSGARTPGAWLALAAALALLGTRRRRR